MNAAKRIAFVLACLLAVSLLGGCAGKTAYPTDNAYHPDTDAQYTWYLQSNRRFFAESPDGYYALLHQKVLHFIDRKTMESIPVCARPDCTHDDSSCNAWFVGFCSVYYVGGTLYVLSQGDPAKDEAQYCNLTKLSADGTERRTILRLPAAFSHAKCILHRGGFYAATTLRDENGNARTGIWRYDLDRPSAAPKLLCEVPVSASDSFALYADNLTAYGHYLYVSVRSFQARLDLNAPEKGFETVFTPLELPLDSVPGVPDSATVMYLCHPGGRLACSTAYTDAVDPKVYYQNMWIRDSEGPGEVKLLGSALAVGCSSADDRYIYRLDMPNAGYEAHADDPYFGSALKVYDTAGTLLENIPVPDLGPIGTVLYVSPGEHVFFSDAQFGIWYISKSEIGSGNVQVHRLTDFGYLE